MGGGPVIAGHDLLPLLPCLFLSLFDLIACNSLASTSRGREQLHLGSRWYTCSRPEEEGRKGKGRRVNENRPSSIGPRSPSLLSCSYEQSSTTSPLPACLDSPSCLRARPNLVSLPLSNERGRNAPFRTDHHNS